MNEEKIQTGLRIPESRYKEIKDLCTSSGLSINSAILFLIEIGLSALNLGVEKAARSLPRIQQHNVEQ